MRITIKYEADDEIDPAAHLLADEIRSSDQFGPYDTVVVSPLTVYDRLT